MLQANMGNTERERNLMDKIEEIIRNEKLKNTNIIIKEADRGGFLSQASSITVMGEDKNGKKRTLHLFLKNIPKGGALREKMRLKEVYTTEIYIYSTLLPRLFQFQEEKKISSPFLSVAKFYNFCELDHNELLIFEDLVSAGYTMWDKTQPMTNEMVVFILKEYAKFHAFSWALRDQRRSEFDSLSKCLNVDLMKFVMEAFKDIMGQNYLDSMQCIDSEKEKPVFEALSALLPDPWQTLEDAEPEECVICHGDSWCNNFMFLFEDSKNPSMFKKVAFLDWQFSKLASPVVDLSYFIYCNASREVLDNLDDYLKIYHDCLSFTVKELGSDIEEMFPYAKLKEHWRKYSKYGMLMSCEVFRGIYNFEKQLPDIGDCGIEKLLDGHCNQNPLYRERIRNMYLHFADNGQ